MKLYRIVYTDLSEGIMVRYKRTKRDAHRMRGEWTRRFPLRRLLSIEAVDIPGIRSTDKTAFVNWLNTELTKRTYT